MASNNLFDTIRGDLADEALDRTAEGRAATVGPVGSIERCPRV